MGGFSLFHWIILLVVVLLWVVPIAKLYRRVGYNRWWALLAVLPPLGLLLVWFLAFAPWRIADADEVPLSGEHT